MSVGNPLRRSDIGLVDKLYWRPQPNGAGYCDGAEMKRRGWDESGPETITLDQAYDLYGAM